MPISVTYYHAFMKQLLCFPSILIMLTDRFVLNDVYIVNLIFFFEMINRHEDDLQIS